MARIPALSRSLAVLAGLFTLAPLAVLAQAASAPAGKVTAASESSTPRALSAEGLLEAARQFEARRQRDAGGPAGTADPGAAAADRARDARSSSSRGEDAPPRDADHTIPEGAAAHAGGVEGQVVTTPAAGLRRPGAAKARPDHSPGRTGASSSAGGPRAARNATARQSAYSGSASTPARGIDPQLRRALAAGGNDAKTYGVLLLENRLDDASRRALEQLGITILGPHGDALKVRVPASALASLARLPAMRSLAYALPDQKLAPQLRTAMARYSRAVPQLPVVVNLFEADEQGSLAERLRATGAQLGRYDAALAAYEMLATPDQIHQLAGLDFVLYIEVEQRSGGGHDQSMATNGVDYIRSSGFLGSGVVLGLLDTGAMLGSAAATPHQDLNKNGCGINFTSDAAGVWNDQNGHGSHVLGTITGTGTAQARFRGVAPALGNRERIRVGKIWGASNTGQNAWLRDAIDYMADASSCDAPRPAVINLSGGASGSVFNGTDAESRKLDARVWETRQAYVVCSGNTGSSAQTIWSPGVAKNALTVGNVQDSGNDAAGEIAASSSRGPTGDGRMKPDLVATGRVVTSVRAGSADQYTDKSGCSMATPHVTGIAASLLEHYPDFRNRPHLLRAHLMASAVLHSDQVTPRQNTSGGRNDYGLGRVSDYQSHWARNDPNGWSGHWAWMTVTDRNWSFFDLDIPRGTRRLVVVLTWDEPAASAGASRAVSYDIDLWADFGANCTPDAVGQGGEWASQSNIDNVEYLIIDNPPAGKVRLKAINWNAPSSGLPVAIAAKIERGDPTPAMSLTAFPSTSTPAPGSTFTITTRVSNPAYEAYGVEVSVPAVPAGLTLLGVSTTRKDGVAMDFPNVNLLTLGTVHLADSRTAVWRFRADRSGPQTVRFRDWSNNGGTAFQSVTVTP